MANMRKVACNSDSQFAIKNCLQTKSVDRDRRTKSLQQNSTTTALDQVDGVTSTSQCRMQESLSAKTRSPNIPLMRRKAARPGAPVLPGAELQQPAGRRRTTNRWLSFTDTTSNFEVGCLQEEPPVVIAKCTTIHRKADRLSELLEPQQGRQTPPLKHIQQTGAMARWPSRNQKALVESDWWKPD